VREVVGALISSYWANGRLEVPEIKWVRTNNYKFHTFGSVHFNPSLSPRPSFRFSKDLVPRLLNIHLEYVYKVSTLTWPAAGWNAEFAFKAVWKTACSMTLLHKVFMADWQWLCLQRIKLSQIPGDLNGIQTNSISQETTQTVATLSSLD